VPKGGLFIFCSLLFILVVGVLKFAVVCSLSIIKNNEKSLALLSVLLSISFERVSCGSGSPDKIGLDIGSGRQDAGYDAGFDSPNCLDHR
jgi:hypothetical protein